MNWIFEPKTGSYTYDEYNGAYGYSIMPYTNRFTHEKGYALYFHNSWRTEKPLGEYINRQYNLSCVYSEPSLGLRQDLIFENIEDAQFAAETHRAKGKEPMSHEGWQDLRYDDFGTEIK